MKHTIEEFSSIFGFGHSASSSTEEGDLCYEISNCKVLEYDQIFEAIQILGMKYQENFFETAMEIFKNKEVFASKKRFMSYVLSRCMKMSETPTLFSFLVLCTFVDNVVFTICNDAECFRVIKMASKCVTAAFYRRYVELFDKEGGFEGFASYCEKLNATVLIPRNKDSNNEKDLNSKDEKDSDSDNGNETDSDSEISLDLEGFKPPDTDKVLEFLQSFKEIDDSNFVLTDYEKKLLYERDVLPSAVDPADDIFIPLKKSSESNEGESLEKAMQNLNIKSKEILDRIDHRCSMCGDNCYKYVVLTADELKVCE